MSNETATQLTQEQTNARNETAFKNVKATMAAMLSDKNCTHRDVDTLTKLGFKRKPGKGKGAEYNAIDDSGGVWNFELMANCAEYFTALQEYRQVPPSFIASREIGGDGKNVRDHFQSLIGESPGFAEHIANSSE